MKLPADLLDEPKPKPVKKKVRYTNKFKMTFHFSKIKPKWKHIAGFFTKESLLGMFFLSIVLMVVYAVGYYLLLKVDELKNALLIVALVTGAMALTSDNASMGEKFVGWGFGFFGLIAAYWVGMLVWEIYVYVIPPTIKTIIYLWGLI